MKEQDYRNPKKLHPIMTEHSMKAEFRRLLASPLDAPFGSIE